MKKVRLFAVAAAMGMFASTVAAAEPVVSTGYTTTWEGVEEIIKVDVGNKVVAPVTTIKVVKETRTTDTKYDSVSDSLGFLEEAPCYTSTDVAVDKDEDNYSDDQIYFIGTENGFYNSVEEAVHSFGLTNGEDLLSGKYLAPGAEAKYYYATKFSNKQFTNEEEVLAYYEELGLVSYEYNEEGDITGIVLNEQEVTNEKGKVLGTAALRYAVGDTRHAEEDAKINLVNTLAGTPHALVDYVDATPELIVKKNYETKTTLKYYMDINEDTVISADEELHTGSVIVVTEGRHGEMEYSTGYTFGMVPATVKYADGTQVVGTEGNITVVIAEKDGSYSKYMTITPTEAKAWTPEARMVWDTEAGSFLKEEIGYQVVAGENTGLTGYWWNNEYDNDDSLNAVQMTKNDLALSALALSYVETEENESDKIVLTSKTTAQLNVTGLNKKTGKMTIKVGDDELTVSAVELESGWYPAVNTEAELVKLVAKLENIGKFEGHVANDDTDALGTNYKTWKNADAADKETAYANLTAFEKWYVDTNVMASTPWADFTFEGDLPESELMGPESEACSYVVSVESEEVTATVEASEVDTTVAGVKTMTLSAKVDGETVATKDVKVVVAPRYERTYVNGKVAVLKSFYLDGTLYSEYHYDWAAKTYTATFYANDGVTVASTANGTL